MSTSPLPQDNTYLIDVESGAEMARLQHQDRLLTRGMGGLLSERQNDFTGLHRIIDIACGPGGWVLDVASAHPDIEVVGIDISQTMITYAQMEARTQGRANAVFRVMDALKPLDFPNNTFDVVNVRFLTGFVPITQWSPFLSELQRITVHGGTIRLTESEFGVSNSAALETHFSLLTRALTCSGHCFSPGGRLVGNTAMLGFFLRQIGCQNVQQKPHMIEYSSGTEAHIGFYNDLKVVFKLLQPKFLEIEGMTQERVEHLYEQMLVEMMLDDFCAQYDLLTVWGTKP